MDDAAIDIRMCTTAAEMVAIDRLLQQIWGADGTVIPPELLQALAHNGGYVAGVFEHDHLVGGSAGFLGRTGDELALHSHVTGLLPGVQHGGVGRALKEHQRAWAAARRIPWITWTFDPLVRPNAWFNLGVLGAHVTAYLVDFYGPMADAVNADDESDRLVVAWPTDPAAVPAVAPGGPTVEVATPDDIVALRRTDPAAAAEWRVRVRAELGEPLAAGAEVVGFTRTGSYQITAPPAR